MELVLQCFYTIKNEFMNNNRLNNIISISFYNFKNVICDRYQYFIIHFTRTVNVYNKQNVFNFIFQKTIFNINMSDTGMNLSPVQEFYKGQTIFITGGTGFMGKVIQSSKSS